MPYLSWMTERLHPLTLLLCFGVRERARGSRPTESEGIAPCYYSPRVAFAFGRRCLDPGSPGLCWEFRWAMNCCVEDGWEYARLLRKFSTLCTHVRVGQLLAGQMGVRYRSSGHHPDRHNPVSPARMFTFASSEHVGSCFLSR